MATLGTLDVDITSRDVPFKPGIPVNGAEYFRHIGDLQSVKSKRTFGFIRHWPFIRFEWKTIIKYGSVAWQPTTNQPPSDVTIS